MARPCAPRFGPRVNARAGIHRRESSLNFAETVAWKLQNFPRGRRRANARNGTRGIRRAISRHGTVFAAPPAGRRACGCAVGCHLSTRGATRISSKGNRTMHRPLLILLLGIAGASSPAIAAPIYKCAGPTGATVFSQTPCGKDAAAVGGSSSATPAAAPVADPASDKAALAGIEAHCKTDSQKIVDGYSAKFADANASIADLHKRLVVKGDKGAEKDPAVQKEIASLEAQKTELLGAQDLELAALRNQCQAERSAEVKRQSDRNAARPVVKR
jgi:hypothetical protein